MEQTMTMEQTVETWPLDGYDLAKKVLEDWDRGVHEAVADDVGLVIPGDEGPRHYVGLSSAGNCRRQRVLGAMPTAEPLPFTTGQLLKFRTGHILEADSRQILLRGRAILVQRREPVTTDDDNVYGHVDGIYCFAFQDGVMHAVWEHKALGDYPWRLTLGKGQRKDSEKKNVVDQVGDGFVLKEGTVCAQHPNYYDQCQAYMTALELERCIWMGRCMQGTGVCVEVLYRSHGVGELLIANLIEDADAVREGMMPRGDYEPGKDWQCRSVAHGDAATYCQYRHICEQTG